MAKKKSKKASRKKRTAKKISAVKRVSEKPVLKKPTSSIASIQRKINVVIKNLILFTILFIISLLLYTVSTSEFLGNMFWIIALITGFIDLAFVISLLVLVILRSAKK